jgi:hypothetical protein
MKLSFQYGFKDLFDTLLYQSIFHCRYTEWAHFAVVFWNFHSSDLMRKEVLQASPDVFHILFRRFRFPVDDGLAVHPCGFASFVPLDTPESKQDVLFACDNVEQTVEGFALPAFLIQSI